VTGHDLGFIPSFADWVKAIRPEPWMGRSRVRHPIPSVAEKAGLNHRFPSGCLSSGGPS
jgi:hypothetical protein